MSLFTCSRCHYTFPSADRPSVCPECGHRQPIPASDVDYNTFYTRRLSDLYEEFAREMTVDERNWLLILRFFNKPGTAYHTCRLLRDYIIEATPELCLDIYKGFRWEFVRRVKQDRIDLQLEGFRESRLLLRKEDGTPVVKGWEHYGAALQALYRFESANPNRTPNLGNINRIDLEAIALHPSPAYLQFLMDWLDSVRQAPSPGGPIGFETKPLLELMNMDE